MSEIRSSSTSYKVMLVAADSVAADAGTLPPTAVNAVTADRSEAVMELYRAEYRGLARLAYLLVHDSHRADDIAHDAFVRLYEHWDRLRNPGSALAYLRSTVVNLAHSGHRRQRTADRHGPAPLVALAEGPPRSVEDEALGRHGRDEVMAALATLSERQRGAVVLRHWLRLTEGEIAEALGCSVGSVRTHLARGHAALATRLEGLR